MNESYSAWKQTVVGKQKISIKQLVESVTTYIFQLVVLYNFN